MKNPTFAILFTFLLSLFSVTICLAQNSNKTTKLALDKTYSVVISEVIMSDGTRRRPVKPTTIRFEKDIDNGQSYVVAIFEDEKFAHNFILQLKKVEEGAQRVEHYTFIGDGGATRKGKLTYYPEMMTADDKIFNVQLELDGYWGKMNYNIFIKAEDLIVNNNEIQKANVNQDLTQLFMAMESGFDNKMNKLIQQEGEVSIYESTLNLGHYEDKYFIKRNNSTNLYYAISSVNNQSAEKQLLNEIQNYSNNTYQLVEIPSKNKIRHFAINKNNELIGFIASGYNPVISTDKPSIIIAQATNSQRLKASIESMITSLNQNPKALEGQLIDATDEGRKSMSKTTVYGAAISTISIYNNKNAWNLESGFLNSSFEEMMYQLKQIDFNIQGTKSVDLLSENFQQTNDLTQAKFFRIIYTNSSGEINIIISNDNNRQLKMEITYLGN